MARRLTEIPEHIYFVRTGDNLFGPYASEAAARRVLGGFDATGEIFECGFLMTNAHTWPPENK